MKQLLTLVCALAISLGIYASVPSGSCGENLTWSLNIEDSVLTINGTGAMQDFVYSTSMPWYSYWPKIKRVILPDGLTTIGNHAFTNCAHLKSINIPEGVISIGDYVFGQCMALPSINIPSSVTTIGEYIFEGCDSLEAINVDEANTVYSSKDGVLFDKMQQTLLQYPIGRRAIEYTVPEGVITIGKSAFEHDTIIEHIYLPQTLQTINSRAFVWCKRLHEIDIPNSVTYMSDNLFGACMELRHVTLSTGITEIEEYTFNGCPIESIIIPEGVTSIGTYAFGWCDNLKNVLLPSSLATINDNAFSSCRQLAEITCEASTPPAFASSETAFYDVDKSNCILYVPEESIELYQMAPQWGEFNIQAIDNEEPTCLLASGTCGGNLTWELSCDGVLTIRGNGAMTDYPSSTTKPWSDYRTTIKTLVVKEGVTSIGDRAFSAGTAHLNEGYKIESITLPNSLTRIGKFAFFDCTTLASLQIPENVESIGYSAFYDCNLTSVTIPASVTYIAKSAFEDNTFLASIEVETGNTVYDSRENCNAIIETATNTLIFGCQNSFIPQGVVAVGDAAFRKCILLPAITFPDGMKTIGPNAFDECSGLTSIELPEGVTTIGDIAFHSCLKLMNVSLPNSLTSIGISAFANCKKLTSITIPKNVTNLGELCFAANNNTLATVTFEPVVPPTIGDGCFSNPYCQYYVPCGNKDAYVKALGVWSGRVFEPENCGEEPEPEPITDYTVKYFDKDESIINSEIVTLNLPDAPSFAGFTFVKWVVRASDLTEGINIQAVYEYNGDPTNAPSVYTNPANSAQKLIRNGNVYVLTDDKTYTITGQKVR